MNTSRTASLLAGVVAIALVSLWVGWQLLGRSAAGGLDGWATGPAIVARDGRTYRPAWGWWSVAVAREDVNAWGVTSTTIVAEGGTDSPCRYVAVISPGGNQPDRLVETADGTLVVLNGGESYLAYEPDSGRSIQGDAIAGVSPFLLFGPNDQVAERAVSALETKAADEGRDRFGIGWIAPSDDVLVEEIGNPNASVRDAARRITRAGGETLYPKASRPR